MAQTTGSGGEAAARGFSEQELAAIRQRAEELRAEGRSGRKKADLEQAALKAIADMAEGDRQIAERVHAIVTRVAPDLTAKTWYGFPAYADGKDVVCFFTSREKGGTRYPVLGFNDVARLDNGLMWPTSYAIVGWSPEVEERVEKLIRRAVEGA